MVDGAEQAGRLVSFHADGNADEGQAVLVHEQLRRMVHCLHAQLLIIPDVKENQAAPATCSSAIDRLLLFVTPSVN